MVEEDRVRFASVRTPQDDQIGLFQLAIGTRAASRSKDRRQTDDAGSVSGTIAAINIVATDDQASKLLCHEVHLVRRLRATEHPHRRPAVRVDDLLETGRRPVQRLIPARWSERSVFTHHGSSQASVGFPHQILLVRAADRKVYHGAKSRLLIVGRQTTVSIDPGSWSIHCG